MNLNSCWGRTRRALIFRPVIVLFAGWLVMATAGFGKDAKCPICEAAKAGDLARVAALLKADPKSVSSREDLKGTALHWAAFKGRADMVSLLLENGADANAETWLGLTPLHAAAVGGNTNVVKLLLARQAKVDARDISIGCTPLHCAAIAGSTEVAALLLANGAKIDARLNKSVSEQNKKKIYKIDTIEGAIAAVIFLADDGATPLHLAARNDNRAVAELLLANKADINARDDFEHTPLYAAAYNGNQDVVALLIAQGAEVTVRDRQGWTPLHAAIFRGYKGVVEQLLVAKADVNAADKQGQTPLQLAAVGGKAAMVKLLREHGAHDPTVDIYEAAGSGDLAAARVLLQGRPDLVSVNILFGMTPLQWAVQKGHLDMAELLLDNKADVNAKDILGETALHYAARNGRPDLVAILLSHGAKINTRNKAGQTPFQLATEGNHKDVINLLGGHGGKGGAMPKVDIFEAAGTGNAEAVRELLEKHPGLVSKKSRTGDTPLHVAAMNGRTEVVKLLLAGKADVNARNDYGVTPLHNAAGNGLTEVVALLLAGGADVNAKDEFGQTPLKMAGVDSRNMLKDLLRQHGGHE